MTHFTKYAPKSTGTGNGVAAGVLFGIGDDVGEVVEDQDCDGVVETVGPGVVEVGVPSSVMQELILSFVSFL